MMSPHEKRRPNEKYKVNGKRERKEKVEEIDMGMQKKEARGLY